MDMNMLEFAHITGGIYEHLELKQTTVMRSYTGMLRIHLLCCSQTPERKNEVSYNKNMERCATDVLNTVNCGSGYFVKKQTGNENMSVA